MVEKHLSSFSQLRRLRESFLRGQYRKYGLQHLRLALTARTSDQLTELRKDFGPGIAGRKSFTSIALGASCEAIIEEKREEVIRCGKPANGTLDFDAAGKELECMPICGDECFEALRKRIASDRQDNGYWEDPATFGRNGFGRA